MSEGQLLVEFIHHWLQMFSERNQDLPFSRVWNFTRAKRQGCPYDLKSPAFGTVGSLSLQPSPAGRLWVAGRPLLTCLTPHFQASGGLSPSCFFPPSLLWGPHERVGRWGRGILCWGSLRFSVPPALVWPWTSTGFPSHWALGDLPSHTPPGWKELRASSPKKGLAAVCSLTHWGSFALLTLRSLSLHLILLLS